ncbi:MAG: ABC transporter ATP-binding protein [Patescibacteria group bacterium]|nr:ABC transporter ATP-binding protein [Patescibacteria group bacterium]
MIITNLTVTYPHKQPALKNISWQIKPGEWLGISGSNGSGKTTLLYCLAGLIPKHISAKITGQTLINQSTGLVFQNPDFSLFNLTVAEEVAFGAAGPIGPALKAVGLSRFKNTDPQTLSYGAKQKVCLAAVLARNPEIILLDEPTAMLDYKSSLDLYRLLAKLNQQGKTIITVEHNTAFLFEFTQKTLILNQGKQIAFGPSRKVLSRARLLKRLGLKPL